MIPNGLLVCEAVEIGDSFDIITTSTRILEKPRDRKNRWWQRAKNRRNFLSIERSSERILSIDSNKAPALISAPCSHRSRDQRRSDQWQFDGEEETEDEEEYRLNGVAGIEVGGCG